MVEPSKISTAEVARRAREEYRQRFFDKRVEVSADARHIVKHLWIIGVVIPLACAFALALLRGL